MKLCSRPAVWVALVCIATSSRVYAQPHSALDLTWQAPPGCPRVAEIRDRVLQLSAPETAVVPLRAEVTIDRAPDGQFQLVVLVRAGEARGERRLRGWVCSELGDALAVHLALLLRAADSAALNSSDLGTSTPPTAAPASITDSSPDEVAPSPRAKEQSEPRRLYVLVQLPMASLSIGPMPRPSPGLALAGGIQASRWQVLLEGHLWLGQALVDAYAPTVGAELHRISAGVQACHALSDGKIVLAPCVRVGVEHLQARGTGANVAPRTEHATWAAGGVGARLRFQMFPWLSIVVSGYVQLEATRPRVNISNSGQLAKLGLAALTFSLGSEWIL